MALTSSNHTVADTGDAHRLQLNPGLSVGIIQRTHAARHGSRLPGSVQNETGDVDEAGTTLNSSTGWNHIWPKIASCSLLRDP